MVKIVLFGFALLGLVSIIGAAPSKADISANFTFEKWVESIIADPNGDNLTPEEAVAAWNRTQATVGHRRLQKRFGCNTIVGSEASIPDAVRCINYLASKGSQACTAAAVSHMCTSGNAQITGVAGTTASTTSSCNDVARGAGSVMDHCSRADNTVQGYDYAWGNGNMAVWIRKPE